MVLQSLMTWLEALAQQDVLLVAKDELDAAVEGLGVIEILLGVAEDLMVAVVEWLWMYLGQ